MDAYHKIKAKDDAFEVIFIPSDREQASFDEFFSGMPWLALPFGDPMKASLSRTLKSMAFPRLYPLDQVARLSQKRLEIL
nr:putative nucleoredoxin 1 [Quercus suber]